MKHYGIIHFLSDIFMTWITGGIWFIYLIFKKLH